MKKSIIVVLVVLIMLVPSEVRASDFNCGDSISNFISGNNIFILDSRVAVDYTTVDYTTYTTQTASNTPQAEANDCDTGLASLIRRYWKWVMFLAPILLIVMMSIDFLKAMSSGDADAINKSASNAIKRVIAAVILLALPWALEVIFGWFGLQICF